MILRCSRRVLGAHFGAAALTHRSSRSLTVPAHFAVLGLASELGELGVGVALGAPHSRRRPPLFAGVGVDTQVHAELPAIGASCTE